MRRRAFFRPSDTIFQRTYQVSLSSRVSFCRHSCTPTMEPSQPIWHWLEHGTWWHTAHTRDNEKDIWMPIEKANQIAQKNAPNIIYWSIFRNIYLKFAMGFANVIFNRLRPDCRPVRKMRAKREAKKHRSTVFGLHKFLQFVGFCCFFNALFVTASQSNCYQSIVNTFPAQPLLASK